MDEGAGSSKSGGYGSPRGKRTQRSPPSPPMNPSGGAIRKARQESPSPEKSMAVPGSPQEGIKRRNKPPPIELGLLSTWRDRNKEPDRSDSPISPASPKVPISPRSPKVTEPSADFEKELEELKKAPHMSDEKLLSFLMMDSVQASLEIFAKIEPFIRTVHYEENTHGTVVILINILGKLHETPIKFLLEDLMRPILAENTKFHHGLTEYINYAIYLQMNNEVNSIPYADGVWSSLERICKYAKKIEGLTGTNNCWASLTGHICRILHGNKHEAFVEKYLIFSGLYEELRHNYFYSGKIYATLHDLQNPKLHIPQITNGSFRNVHDYLDFQVNYLKDYFLSRVGEGIAQYNALDKEQKKKAVFRDFYGINIYPRVKLHDPFHKQEFLKYYYLDLAPFHRKDGVLFSNVWDEVIGRDLRKNIPVVYLLSTTSNFTKDIITAVSVKFPKNMATYNKNGYAMIQIFGLENIYETILNRDLFLVTIPETFEQKFHTLKVLQYTSAAEIPMKEYLVHCERPVNLLPEHLNDLQNFELNMQQFEAVQKALSQRVTVIHGYPGTGKSLVFHHIMKHLLSRTSHKILVVSYRNSFLDDAMVRCLTLTNSIVRVGTSVTEEGLKNYVLPEEILVKDKRFIKIINRTLYEFQSAVIEFNATSANPPEYEEGQQNPIDKKFQNVYHKLLKEADLLPFQYYLTRHNMRIMGITSVGAAKYRLYVEFFRPTVVIVEDAALLPEPHLITALKNSTEHLIMIGDPTQISFGKTTFPNHLPGTTYFERTIEKGYAVKLNIQYRMHPDIAELVRDVFFNDLVDGDDVRNILPISGIGRNLFCVTTTIEPIEVANRELLGLCANNFAYYKIAYATKENVATLLFISKLVLYLFNHGYTKNDIVILTSDDAHEDAVERCMSIFTIYKNVQVKSINHFAGKECRLGIVCLLRNENEKEIGFPEEEGILSSLLTRAREGLIIVENLSTMPEENQVWKRVSSKLREMQAIATYFPARCEVHGAEIKMVTYLDFEIFINEGCSIGSRLPCMDGRHPCLMG
ncbi:uncharacterized protein LOC129787692 [Lutzomyia longipalpis]|uniref:uncharacterized protein LOC129787692 n=1 Tax=Lutzomyia longipalpis TaxID=7200 RepID=UPI0024843F3C|nr:uncharacterized protein LOC129787692 [Lutzomyia longipalpis]